MYNGSYIWKSEDMKRIIEDAESQTRVRLKSDYSVNGSSGCPDVSLVPRENIVTDYKNIESTIRACRKMLVPTRWERFVRWLFDNKEPTEEEAFQTLCNSLPGLLDVATKYRAVADSSMQNYYAKKELMVAMSEQINAWESVLASARQLSGSLEKNREEELAKSTFESERKANSLEQQANSLAVDTHKSETCKYHAETVRRYAESEIRIYDVEKGLLQHIAWLSDSVTGDFRLLIEHATEMRNSTQHLEEIKGLICDLWYLAYTGRQKGVAKFREVDRKVRSLYAELKSNSRPMLAPLDDQYHLNYKKLALLPAPKEPETVDAVCVKSEVIAAEPAA